MKHWRTLCVLQQTELIVDLVPTWTAIGQSHYSHNTFDKYPTMHHFVTQICKHVHISITKCCIVGYGTGALWDYELVQIMVFITSILK